MCVQLSFDADLCQKKKNNFKHTELTSLKKKKRNKEKAVVVFGVTYKSGRNIMHLDMLFGFKNSMCTLNKNHTITKTIGMMIESMWIYLFNILISFFFDIQLLCYFFIPA